MVCHKSCNQLCAFLLCPRGRSTLNVRLTTTAGHSFLCHLILWIFIFFLSYYNNVCIPNAFWVEVGGIRMNYPIVTTAEHENKREDHLSEEKW